MADNNPGKDEAERWKEIYKRFYPALCYFANSILNDAEKAEDVVQSVLIKTWQDQSGPQDSQHLKNYLYKVVRHAAINELSIHSNRARILKKLGAEDEERYLQKDAFYGMVKTELLRQIQGAISKLPNKTANVFKLAYLDQKSNTEIAEQLSITVNTVKVHKNNAKKALRTQLKDLYPLVAILFFKGL